MCACDTFILLFVTDSLSCILNSFISTLLKKYYTFNGHLQPSRPFFGESRLWEVCGCKPQEIRLQKFKRQIQVLKMSEAKLVESGAIAKDLDERFFGENSSPKLEGGAQKWKWDRVCSKLSCLTWFSLLSWHLENAKVARAFPAAQGWNIVAWWFGKGNPLQALHDVGGLLEGPWDRQTFWRIRKVKWHNPTNIFGAQTNSQAVSIRLYIYIYTWFSVSLALPCEDAKGEPAPDTNDGVMYVITEVAQYSLKDSEVEKTTAGWLGGRWEFGSRISILQ